MRAFAEAWPEREMLQSDIAALPWAHVTLLLDKLSDRPTRDWYAPRSPPDLLPLTPADRMLSTPANDGVSDGDAADGCVSESLPVSPLQRSIQRSVLSKTDPAEPDPTPATTRNPTVPDPLGPPHNPKVACLGSIMASDPLLERISLAQRTRDRVSCTGHAPVYGGVRRSLHKARR